MNDFPDAAPGRPPWLMTLADLALLLLGFVVLVQATAAPRREALGRSMRKAFGAEAEADAPLPVAAYAVRFAPGSATLADPGALIAWAEDAVRDPRVALTVTGATDGSAADTAAAGPLLLANDRTRAVALALARTVPASRLRLLTDPAARGRAAIVTIAFTGERP